MKEEIYFNSNKENVVNLATYRNASIKNVIDSFNYLYKDRKDTIGFEYKDDSEEAQSRKYILKVLQKVKRC